MKKTPNKTNTTPDGTTFRVEADGSVTKVRTPHIQPNEPPSKCQITPDGKIFRIEDDGSITYLDDTEKSSKQTGNGWIWLVLILAFLAMISIIFIYQMFLYL